MQMSQAAACFITPLAAHSSHLDTPVRHTAVSRIPAAPSAV